MANETRGILYETITEEALRQAVTITDIPGIVRWNEKPDGMSVNPDFTIGVDKDEPSHLILVTASGSSHDSDKKFWRNLGELQEAKAQLQSSPRVINIFFKSEIKVNLNVVSHMLYDVVMIIDEKPYFPSIETWVKDNLKNIAKTKASRRDLLADDLKSNAQLAGAINLFVDDLAKVLNTRNSELDALWKIMHEDYLKTHDIPNARVTSVRRGLAKLMVLEPEIRKLVYTNNKRLASIPVAGLPEYIFDLGFFNKVIGGARLDDSEIKGVISLLGPEKCEAVLTKSPSSMMTWVNPLRNLERADVYADFVHENYDKIIDPDELRDLFIMCYTDPAKLSGIAGEERVWLFEILISLIKTKSGKLQGYGLSQISVDTGISEIGRGSNLMAFLSKFTQRIELPNSENLRLLAKGISQRFSNDVTRSDLPHLKKTVVKWIIKENLEDRLIPYRNFEPLLQLLYTALEKQEVKWEAKATFKGWVGEYVQVTGTSATTPFVRVGDSLIHWKSVSDMGKVHKKKELAARARIIKYQYDTSTSTFTRRQGVKQLVLIVDGTFNDADLKILIEAGWDRIIYPDEIENFVMSLKR